MPMSSMLSSRRVRPARTRIGWMGAFLVLLAASFCILTTWSTVIMHQQIRMGVDRSSQSLLDSEVDGITRILMIYDGSLRSAATMFNNPILRDAPPKLRRLAIFDDVQDMPLLGPVRILAADGSVLYDSITPTPSAASPAELAALALHSATPDTAVMISPPFETDGKAFAITLSHRIPAMDGSFGGIVVGVINLELFQAQFRKINMGSHDVVTLFSDKGVVLAHIPGNPEVGRSIAGTDILKKFQESKASNFSAVSTDQVFRVFSFRHFDGWPLFLDVGVSTKDLYRPWLIRTVITACLMMVLIIMTVVLMRVLKRDRKARLFAEDDLAFSTQQYQILAESGADIILRVDRQTILTYVSPSIRQLGYEPEELIGGPSSSLIHKDDMAAAREVFFRTIDRQVEAITQYRLRNKAGEYTRVEAYLSPIRQGGYLAVIRSIENRALEQHDRALVERIPVNVLRVDNLTKLASRPMFNEALPAAWRRATEGGMPLSLVLIKIDHYRSYHELYGDRAGEDVLINVAQHCDVQARKVGGVANCFDDDAFAIILPGADLKVAVTMAEAIQSAVLNEMLRHADSPSGQVTISTGAATMMPGIDASSHVALLYAADEALMGGKNSFNRVQAVTPA